MEREIRRILNAGAVAFPTFFCVPFRVCVLAERYVPSVPPPYGAGTRNAVPSTVLLLVGAVGAAHFVNRSPLENRI